MPDDAESFVLRRGSVLFVPRGYWHATQSDEDTLALNFTFGQPTWADVLLTALRTRVLKDASWRALARGPAGAMRAKLMDEVAKLDDAEVADALDLQTAYLLVPRGFLRIEDGAVIASLGTGTFEIDADVSLHPVLEWIGRQRTPFSVEQAALHFPTLTPGLPQLIATLTANRLLGTHRCRPSEQRD